MKLQITTLLALIISWEAESMRSRGHSSRGDFMQREPRSALVSQGSHLHYGPNTPEWNALERATNINALVRGGLNVNMTKNMSKLVNAPGRSHALYSALQTATSSYALQPKEGNYGAYKTRVNSCKDCIAFYPKIEQGGSADGHYREWPAQCYVGDCKFEDPWAAGPPDTSCGDAGWECWYWGLQDMCKHVHYGGTMRTLCKATCGTCTGQKFCFSRDPIAYYDDCQQVLYADATQVMDLSRVCEYNHQIQVMSNPQVWFGNIKPFTIYLNMGTKELDCTDIIQGGGKVYADDDSFDTVKKPGTEAFPLGQCCERVHKYFTCVGNPEKEKLISKDAEGLDFLDQASFNILGAFNSYCQPLFLYPSKPEFCEKYPTSDPCVIYTDCLPCVEHKGVWCPETKKCMSHEPSKGCTPWTEPHHCPPIGGTTTPSPPPPPATTTLGAGVTTTTITPKHNWWYEIVGGGNYFAKDYIPDKIQKVKQGHPGQFHPEATYA